MMFTIEKLIPIPEQIRKPRRSIYPFDKMAVGDSFLAPRRSKTAVYAASHDWRTRHKAYRNFKFMMREEKLGTRCWRIV